MCREISKLHEETVRGTLAEVIAHFTATEPRGEIVIILGGSSLPASSQARLLGEDKSSFVATDATRIGPKRGDSAEDAKDNSSRKRKKND